MREEEEHPLRTITAYALPFLFGPCQSRGQRVSSPSFRWRAAGGLPVEEHTMRQQHADHALRRDGNVPSDPALRVESPRVAAGVEKGLVGSGGRIGDVLGGYLRAQGWSADMGRRSSRGPGSTPPISSACWRMAPRRLPNAGFVKLLRLRRSSGKRVPLPGPTHPLGGPLRTRDFGPTLEAVPHLLAVLGRRQQMPSWVGSVGRWDHTPTESAGHAPPT